MKSFLFLFAVLALMGCKPDAQEAVAEDEAVVIAPAATPGAVIPLPEAMLVNGQPIDPLCFESPVSDDPEAQNVPVQLNNCRGDDIIVLAAASLSPDAEGLVGYEYGYKMEDGGDPVMGAFAKYRYLGTVDGHQAVLSIQSGGGSGTFTMLSTFDRVGDTMVRVRDYAGGDRCNNGITDASVTDGHLLYSVNLTPPDILQLGGLTEGYEPYTDLEASASSCFAMAQYQDEKLTGIALTPDALQDRADWTENYPDQACFNKVARDLVTQGPSRLDPQGVQRLTQGFRDSCLKDK